MKAKFLILLIFASINFASMQEAIAQQDIILKNDKSEIHCNVLGLQGDYIRYSLDSSQIKNIPISEIFMIIYENGSRETFDVSNSSTSKETSKEQNSSEGWVFGGKGGYFIPWNEGVKELFGSGFMLGGVIEYRGTKSGLGLDFKYYSKTSEGLRFSVLPITLTGYWQLYSEKNFRTYFGGGLGFSFITLANTEDSSDKINSEGFELHTTGGVSFKPFYFEISFSSVFADDYEEADMGGIILGFGFFF